MELLTNAGTDRINNLFPALMFTPASYNEDKSDVGGHTTIQLLSPNPRTRVPRFLCRVIPAGIDGRDQNLRLA